MEWNRILANRLLDEAIITAGIAVLIVRQFIWRSTRTHDMLRLPVVIMGAGVVYLALELWEGFVWVPADWIIVGEILLVAVTGTIMGHVTRFRTADENLQYRLDSAGIWLWALFVAIRVGAFYLASDLGANLTGATGLILLSFGVNRLAAVVVVRRRADEMLTTGPLELAGNANPQHARSRL